MLGSRANEIPRLIRQLGHRDRARVDAARARLSVIGGRAVEHLIAALEGDRNRVRSKVMPLLATIQDSRAREPLIAMLLDPSGRMREIAARCLSRFPSPETVAALERTLQTERWLQVRIAAVHSLVGQSSAGEDRAVRRVLDILLDPKEPEALRVAAMTLLRTLRRPQRQAILRRLGDDPAAAVREEAEHLASWNESAAEVGVEDIAPLLASLRSDSYPEWNQAVERLGSCGTMVISPVVDAMRQRAHDPEFCTRAGMALKALGPRKGKPVVEALEQVDDPLPLQVLVDVIGAFGEKALIYRLKELIERVASLEDAEACTEFDLMRRVRAKAHLELARIGSRVAILDLRKMLSDERRLDLETVTAVELIGKREELPLLLRVWTREDRFVKTRLGDAVRSIMKRERIRRDDSMFQALTDERREAFDAIAQRGPHRARRPRPRRRRRAEGDPRIV